MINAMNATTTGKDDALVPAAPDVAAEVARWLGHLGDERRMSAKTLDAYQRDARQFLVFLAGHLGGAPTLADLARLAPQDVRAFMAARRAAGVSGRSLMRTLAGVRSFARFLERNGKGKVAALAAVRAPKVPRRCRSRSPSPRPSASPTPICAQAKRASPGCWRAMPRCWRCCTAAGCASPKRSGSSGATAPGKGDAITVTGKGNKQRMVPVLRPGGRADRRLRRALSL